ncbi:hypothetical protein BGX27_009393 [Mortierella sp. AM989]|nr:hypothetical protein BGX27_009393 [Mortierella sp. AM989]
MAASTTTRLFELPEIIHVLAQSLKRHELVQCVKVSKEWHSSFSPYIWSEIKLSRRNTEITPDTLTNYRHLIKKITCIDKINPWYAEIHFPNLCSLHLLRFPKTGQDLFATILDHHSQSITDLKIAIQNSTVSPTFWESVLGLHGLKRLVLTGTNIRDNRPTARFWEICPRLKSLMIHQAFLPEASSLDPSTTIFSKVQELYVILKSGGELDGHLKMLACFPNLTSLAWSTDSFQGAIAFPLDGFAEMMALGAWSQLQQLFVSRCQAEDEILALIISSMTRVKKLHVRGADFGSIALEALRPHFPFLEALDISSNPESPAKTGHAVIEILTHCPKLEILGADRVLGWHIQEGDNWVCKDTLKLIQLCFQLSQAVEPKSREQDIILGKLSELKNLEVLNVTNNEIPSCDLKSTLDLRVQKGLNRLATLGYLREFVFDYTKQWMEMEDIEWMLIHWPNLESVQGAPNEDEDVSIKLRAILHNRGIEAY